MMRIIVVTAPESVPEEPEMIRLLLSEGVDRVHLRKPQATEIQMRQLIESLPPTLYPRITLQDCLSLAGEYGIGGVHLNRRNTQIPSGFQGLVSCSCHSLEEVTFHRWEDYLFLSPIFDSISKEGYRSAFTPRQLDQATRQGLIDSRIIALGGILPEHLPELKRYGFGGAAFLGYIWQEASREKLMEKIKTIRKFNNQ